MAFSMNSFSSLLWVALLPVAGEGAVSRPMYLRSLERVGENKSRNHLACPTCDNPRWLSGFWAGHMTRPPCSYVPPGPNITWHCSNVQTPEHDSVTIVMVASNSKMHSPASWYRRGRDRSARWCGWQSGPQGLCLSSLSTGRSRLSRCKTEPKTLKISY